MEIISIPTPSSPWSAELNDFTRFVCMRINPAGGIPPCGNVLTWRTGSPYAVNLARGYPRYGPGEYNAGTFWNAASATRR